MNTLVIFSVSEHESELTLLRTNVFISKHTHTHTHNNIVPPPSLLVVFHAYLGTIQEEGEAEDSMERA